MSKISEVARAAASAARKRPFPKFTPRQPLQPRPSEDAYYVDNRTYNKRRRLLWAGGIVIITAAGAILGAQLKTWSETSNTQRNSQPASAVQRDPKSPSLAEKTKPPAQKAARTTNNIAQQIATLEATKATLRVQKARLQEKVDRIRARKQENETIEVKPNMNTKR